MFPSINRSPDPAQNQVRPSLAPTTQKIAETSSQEISLDLTQDLTKLVLTPHLDNLGEALCENINIQFFSEEENYPEAMPRSSEEAKQKAKTSLLKDEKLLHQAQDKFSQIQNKYLLSYRRYEQAQDLLTQTQKQKPDNHSKINTLKFEVQRLHAETEQGRWALEQQNSLVDRHQLQVDRSRNHYLLLNKED